MKEIQTKNNNNKEPSENTFDNLQEEEIKHIKNKKENGVYFTKGNCFILDPFKQWFNHIPKHKKLKIIEPFAGDGQIPFLMKNAGYKNEWEMYDLNPTLSNIKKNDSIKSCPIGTCIITNPPYLAKYSASRKKIKYPEEAKLSNYDDVYKLALEKMLYAASYVGAIVPESFITSGLFLNRIDKIISLKFKMFDDTDCPVCLALFSPKEDYQIWSNDVLIGNMSDLSRFMPNPKEFHEWKFNSRKGDIGLINIDNNKTESIRFVEGNSIPRKEIKYSSRLKTRILGDKNYELDKLLNEANSILSNFRTSTEDVFLTAFKGIRADGKYRRRLDYNLAKSILDVAYNNIQNQKTTEETSEGLF